jgi:hypothetical protein
MKIKNKIFILLSLAVTLSLLAAAGIMVVERKPGKKSVNGQLPSAQSEYPRIMQRFMQKDSSISLNGSIDLYDGARPDVLKERSFFSYLRSGRNFYSRMASQQTFFNGRLLVQTDSLYKIIIVTTVNDNDQTGEQMENAYPDGLMSRLFSDTARFKIAGVVAGDDQLRSITITSDFNPEIQNFTIYYSPRDYSMRSAEVRFYKNGRRPTEDIDGKDLWISKINYEQSPVGQPDIDGMIRKVLTIEKDHVAPAAAYRDYKLIIK